MPLVKELRIIGRNDVRGLVVVCTVCMYVLIAVFASFACDSPRFNY